MSDEKHNYTTQKKGKGFLGGLGKISLVIFALIIGYIILDKMGIEATNQSEKTTWHDKNHIPDRDYDAFIKTKKQRKKEEEKFEEEAEMILAQFIKEKGRKENISSDDRNFLDDVSQRLKTNNRIQNSSEFISFIQSSYKFYSAMKSIGKAEESRSSKWMNKLLNQDSDTLDDFAKKKPSGEEWMEFLAN